jgi:glucosamine-phosphate N-acetyltransferase
MNNIDTISLKTIINDNNIENIKNNYISLLSNLTIVNNISTTDFIKYIETIYNNGIVYIIYLNNKDIIASGTIFIEQKIIRNGHKVGHIEDIVVDPKYRGFGLSSIIINKLKEYGIENNCYKIILDCDEKVKNVYEKCGFIKKSIQMAIYI